MRYRMHNNETEIAVDQLTYTVFSENLNSTFRIHLSTEKSLDVELTEITEHMISDRQERFSLFFRGPLDAFVPQATYRFEHEKMGPFDLFIVPIGKTTQGFLYEAVFNNVRHSS